MRRAPIFISLLLLASSVFAADSESPIEEAVKIAEAACAVQLPRPNHCIEACVTKLKIQDESAYMLINVGAMDGVCPGATFKVFRGPIYICDLKIITTDKTEARGYAELKGIDPELHDLVKVWVYMK